MGSEMCIRDRFFDSNGDCIDDLPSGATPCEGDDFRKLCDIDDKLQELIDLEGQNVSVTTCYELNSNINNGGNTRNVGPSVGTNFSYIAPTGFTIASFNANFDDTGNIDGYTVTNTNTGESTTTNGFTWTGTFSQLSQGVFTLETPLEVNTGDLLTFEPLGTPTGRFLRFNFTNTSQVFPGLDGVGDGVNMLRVQIIGVQNFTVITDSNGNSTATNDLTGCLLYTSPSPRDLSTSRMPSSA